MCDRTRSGAKARTVGARLGIILGLITAALSNPAIGEQPMVLAPLASGAMRDEFVTDVPMARAQSIMRTRLAGTARASDNWRRYRTVATFGSPLFPSDAELAQFEPTSPSLQSWLQIPAAERRHDLLIRPDEDYYWMGDYMRAGKPVEFAAEFIVHLSPVAGEKSRVSVIQIRSRVRLGKTFDLTGRAGPGFYWNIEAVAPSPMATADLTDFLAGAFTGQKL